MLADSLPAEPLGKPKNIGVGSPIPSPAHLPNPGIEPESPALQADYLPAELPGKPNKLKKKNSLAAILRKTQTGLPNNQGERKVKWAQGVILVETVGFQIDSVVLICPWELFSESSGRIQPRSLGKEPWEGGLCIS